MAVARSFSGGVTIRYVLPVLWLTTGVMFAHNEPGKGDVIKASTRSDSPGGVAYILKLTQRAARGRGGVCCLRLPRELSVVAAGIAARCATRRSRGPGCCAVISARTRPIFTKLTHQGAAPPGGGICCLLLSRCCLVQVPLHGVRQGVLAALAATRSPALTHFTKLTHQGATPHGGGICCLLFTRCCHVQVPLHGVRQGVLAAVAAARSPALTHAPSSPN